MKIIRTIFLILLALSLAACVGILIFFKTFDTHQYLPQIVKKASLALGRPVSITGVGLGFSLRGITLDAGPVTIADDPDFTRQPFIKVDRVRISFDLGVLILRREIRITDIFLQSPQIHFIRSQEGNFNCLSVFARSEATKQSFNSRLPRQTKSEPRNGTKNRMLFRVPASVQYKDPIIGGQSLKSVIIQDASISFIDQSRDMPLDVWLTNINASLNDVSLSKHFRLSFNASPLVFKSIPPQMPDSPIFKNISAVAQLNRGRLDGNIIITDGVIKSFNIIKTVLSHTLVFGGIDGYINRLGVGDTVIEDAEAGFSFHDKTLFIDNALIKTNIFEFTAKGSVDQGLYMDMQTMLYLNGDVSAALVNELDELKYFMDDSKRIAVDANLEGVIPHLKYKPNKDFKKKGKKAINALFRQLLGA